MKIKRIKAKNFRTALSMIKKELGNDAVILSSEDRKGARSYVEVTAAVDYDNDSGNDAINRQVDQADTSGAVVSGSNTAGASMAQDLAEMRRELTGLRSSIDSMRNSGFEIQAPAGHTDLLQLLRSRSIEEDLALKIVERADTAEGVEEIMARDLNITNETRDQMSQVRDASASECRRITMLIGPTGVGKTTTIAKLASMGIKEGKKVAMISIDTFKIGAAEQIRIYSRMIGIPLDIVSGRDELRKSVSRFSDRDLILIDTTGHNPKDEMSINNLNSIFQMGMPMETQLLMSSSSDGDFLMNTHRYYGSFPVDYMAFTKTDEAVKLGSIYNICSLYRKPVAYITTGQRVPGNIEFVDSRRLSNLILTTGSA